MLGLGGKSEVEFLRELVAQQQATIEKLTAQIASLADPMGQARIEQVKALTARALNTPQPDQRTSSNARPGRSHNPSMVGRHRPDVPSETDAIALIGRTPDFDADPGLPAEKRG